MFFLYKWKEIVLLTQLPNIIYDSWSQQENMKINIFILGNIICLMFLFCGCFCNFINCLAKIIIGNLKSYTIPVVNFVKLQLFYWTFLLLRTNQKIICTLIILLTIVHYFIFRYLTLTNSTSQVGIRTQRDELIIIQFQHKP